MAERRKWRKTCASHAPSAPPWVPPWGSGPSHTPPGLADIARRGTGAQLSCIPRLTQRVVPAGFYSLPHQERGWDKLHKQDLKTYHGAMFPTRAGGES